MGLGDRPRRLEETAEGEVLVIPQRDGREARFPPGAGEEAFMNLVERLGAGEDAPPEHPSIGAARNPSDPKWGKSSFFAVDSDPWKDSVKELSE